MDRRRFIHLAGGGIALAATTGLSGCSTAYPPEAVAAWQGPGNEPDPRLWALGFAILAPNSHNRQPWRVDLREPNAITLHVDTERTLPMTDPWFRQIVVSQGTFIESLVVALRERGLDPQVTLFPMGAFAPRQVDDRPVARVHWTPGAPAPAKDPLFAQLLHRHTAKVDYDTSRPVDADTLAALARAAQMPGVRYGATVEPGRVATLRSLCRESARVELSTPRTVMESLQLTRVGPDAIARHRDGISLNGWMPRLAAAVGALDLSRPPPEGSTAWQQMIQRFDGHSATAMGFLWLSTPFAQDSAAGTTRHAEVNAGRAYLRVQLMATGLGLQVHPMSQAPQEFAEMKPHYDALHQQLLGRPASEEVVQLFCRVGYCAKQAHTPRRPLSDFVRSAPSKA